MDQNTALTQTITVGEMKVSISRDQAQTTNTYRIGDRVKILVKDYSDYSVYYGIIAAFDNFKNLPSITVCYIENKYGKGEMKFCAINKQMGDKFEIVPCLESDKIDIDQGDIVERMQAEIDKKQAEIEDIHRKINYFNKMFRKWFDPKQYVEDN